MQAIILCAGKATRMHPLTLTRPKSLLPIAGKPILAHNLDQLVGLVEEAIIVHQGDMIKNTFGSTYKDMKLSYVEQEEQKGTFHALQSAAPILKDEFLVLMGDDLYSRKDMQSLSTPSILVKEVNQPQKFGVVLGEKQLEAIHEKSLHPPSSLANTGCFRLSKNIFNHPPSPSPRGELELTDAVTSYAKDNPVAIVKSTGYWLPIGYPWDLLTANEFLLKQLVGQDIRGVVEKGATIKGPVKIGSGSVVKAGSTIEGPVTIGQDCVIGPNCYIRPSTSVGNSCHVGNGSEIKNSILFNNAKVPHLSYVGDSILGESVNIGGGSMLTNLRHDNTTIQSRVNSSMVDTGKRKFGAVLGDGVKIGANTTILPGRTLSPEATTRPGTVVEKDI